MEYPFFMTAFWQLFFRKNASIFFTEKMLTLSFTFIFEMPKAVMCLIFLLRPRDNLIIYPKREALKCDYGHGLRGTLKIQESQINLITQDWGIDGVGGSIQVSSQLAINVRQGSQVFAGAALIWRGQFDNHSREQAAYLCEINIQLGRKDQFCNHS